MVAMRSVSSLRRSLTMRELIERSKASAFSAGAAAMMSSRVSTLPGIVQEQPEQRHLPGRQRLFGAAAVHDQRRLEVDGRVFQDDEVAAALAAAGDQPRYARRELALR